MASLCEQTEEAGGEGSAWDQARIWQLSIIQELPTAFVCESSAEIQLFMGL